jgi:RimJ/RimL family protein N-acetyltransferase
MFETSRLHVHPLTHAQLLQCVRIDHSLEQALQLKPIPRNISSELKEALDETILPNVKASGAQYRFSTLWTAVLNSEQVMVADLCIMGEPNKDGAIEIGYGTYEAFQGQGFMTELVGGIVSWAREEPSVKSIKAATDKPILHRSGCWKRMAF